MMRDAIITGCAGFVGSELTRQLVAAGHRVTGIDDFSRGTMAHVADSLKHPSFRLVHGDIRRAEDLQRAFREGAEYVFHLAARHFIPECIADPAGTYEINLIGTQRVWDAAKQAGCRRFLFVSTGDVYRPSTQPHAEHDATEPFNAYGLSKLTAERVLTMENGPQSPELVIARLFNVYGPGETNPHLLPEILQQVRDGARRLELGNLWPIRDFIFVRDVAEAFIRLVDAPKPPSVVNVGSGAGWSVAELVAMIAQATARPIEAVSIPEKCRSVERDVLRPDISRLAAATRWHPQKDLLQGLRETLATSV